MRRMAVGIAVLSVCVLALAGCGSKSAPQASAENTALPTVDASAVADQVEVVSFAPDPEDDMWAILSLKAKEDWSGRQLALQIKPQTTIPIAGEGKAGQTFTLPMEFFLFKDNPTLKLVWE